MAKYVRININNSKGHLIISFENEIASQIELNSGDDAGDKLQEDQQSKM